jgi:hypothetical protein
MLYGGIAVAAFMPASPISCKNGGAIEAVQPVFRSCGRVVYT